MKKIEIPKEVKDAVIDEAEKVIFPHEAKTLGGRILRVLFSIGKIFILKKKIDS